MSQMKNYRDFGWYFLPRLFSSCRQIVKCHKNLVLCVLNWTECFLGLSILTFYFVFFLWIGFYSFLKNYLIIFVWLHWVFIAVLRPSLDVANRGYSLVAEHGPLIAVASLCHRAWALWRAGFCSCRAQGSVLVTHGV